MALTMVAKPIDYRGLGIIELHAFSRALHVRLLWFQWSNPERPRNDTELPIDVADLALFNTAMVVTVRNRLKASFNLAFKLD